MTTSPVLASEIKLGGGSDDPAGTQPMTPVMPRVASQPFSLTKLTMTYHPETIGLENLFIGIAGLIGAGKTTLCTALGKALDLPCYYEPVIDNEYLSDFYQDRKRYSFPLQIYLLNQRFRQQQQIIWQGKGGVQDRTIYEDSVFARMLRDRGEMDERDFKTYMSLFANMSNFMRKPNLIIYLDVNPEESAERILSRSRDMEKGIPIDYLTDLRAAYEEFIRDISRVIPVIRVSWSKFRTAEEMAALVKSEYLKLCNIRTVSWEEDEAAFAATTAAAAAAAAGIAAEE